MENNDKYIQQLLKDLSFLSILYIDKYGQLRRVFCPFVVKAVYDLPFIKKGQKVSVDKMAVASNLYDVYIINGKAYYIFYFILIGT